MSAVAGRLRPHPHRGDIVASGAVPLVVAAVLIEARMGQWPIGARFVVVAGAAGLVLTMASLAPLERQTPRAYHSVLLVSGLLALIVALQLLAEVLGAHRPPGAGAVAWTLTVEAFLAAWLARRANSGGCTLIAALAGAIAAEAADAWLLAPRGIGTFRAILVPVTVLLAAGAVGLRDRRRRHAVALVNAAGLLTVALSVTLLGQAAVTFVERRLGVGAMVTGHVGAGFGWKAYVLAVGLGLVAYAAVDYEPGPGYLGIAVLVCFIVLAAGHSGSRGSLLGWPLFLLVLAAIGLAVGLRPRRELPPPPGPATPAPTVPLRGAGGNLRVRESLLDDADPRSGG